jgi:hypothetical protein
MAEHAVLQAVAIEQRAQFGDVSANCSGGTAVSSTNGCGRASPATLPSSPTARLRMP